MYEPLLRIHTGLNGEDKYVDIDYERLKKALAPLFLARFIMEDIEDEVWDNVNELEAEEENED